MRFFELRPMTEQRFKWKGINQHGQCITGNSYSKNKSETLSQLRSQRIRVTQIHRQFDLSAWIASQPFARIQLSDITRITRQLATLLHAGVPLLQSLEILDKGESRKVISTVIRDIQTKIESGRSLYQALEQHPEFDSLYCNLVAVGEVTGMLDAMLERVAIHLEKSEALRKTLRSALLYPCVVVLVALSVLTVILVFVVPAFQSIFSAFNAELPWLTRQVISISSWVQHEGWLMVICLISFGILVYNHAQNNLHLKRGLDRMWICLPIIGPLIRHAYTARWTRTLSTLFACGIPLTEALASVQGTMENTLFKSATQSIQQQLIQGSSLSQAIAQTHNLFPPMLPQMCAIGEESGALDEMLEKTAEFYEQKVDHAVAQLSTLLEPVIMVVLGVLVGGLVMALYLPIFQLGQVI